MKTSLYDLIGDIHGQYDKLSNLLAKLGYEPQGQGFRHPEGRKVIFLGDYIDRGPKVREVLRTVRAMTEAGEALAIMGNHEYNAICWHTPDGAGGWLRPRQPEKNSGLLTTLKQFVGLENEWNEWIGWMRELPPFLDLGSLRAVHACWDARQIEALKVGSFRDDAFLHESARKGGHLYHAVEQVLKGPEMALPEGFHFHDKEGVQRREVRVRWWNIPKAARVSHLALPVPFDVPGEASEAALAQATNYAKEEPPVFFGHYWMPADQRKAPLGANIACLDFSAAFHGPLVAYRWEGEQVLSSEKFLN